MAIANRTCVSFCNQPKAQFGYLRRVTPVCRCLLLFCGWRHLATSRESKAHFGLSWVRIWDNRSKCYINGKRIQCSSNASQHVPSIFNRFPVIQPVSSKVRHFSIFLHILVSPGYAPETIAVNVTWIEREFNAGQKHRSIYPSIFNCLRAIARYWSEISTFSYPLAIGWAVSTQYQRVTDVQPIAITSVSLLTHVKNYSI